MVFAEPTCTTRHAAQTSLISLFNEMCMDESFYNKKLVATNKTNL